MQLGSHDPEQVDSRMEPNQIWLSPKHVTLEMGREVCPRSEELGSYDPHFSKLLHPGVIASITLISLQ